MNKLKICAISDLHGILPLIEESADVLLIAGDVIPLSIQFNKLKSHEWFITVFADWVKNLPVDKVIMVAGNHDAHLESISNVNLQLIHFACENKLVYLCNETTNYICKNGLTCKIFGTPYCHIFGSWPFMRSESYMEEKFKEIPDKVDIIISHDPPFCANNVDAILERPRHSGQYENVGNKPLKTRLSEIDYKLLVCGHIHSGNHDLHHDNFWKCVNVSILNENYALAYPPFYTEIEHG